MKKSNSNKRGKKGTTNKKKVWKKVLLIMLFIILIAGSVFAYKVYKNGGGMSGMLATVVGHDENTKKNLGEFKCLILGISTDQENVDLTDTIMVASYNPNTQKATLLSIPRDTYTGKTPAKATAYEKINALYSRKHRPDETLKAVNEITDLDIKYYVVVKTEALIKLVDVIGGITFDVPIDMNYDDPTQDLYIHLSKGYQKLTGAQVEQLVRFRHNNNGISYPFDYGNGVEDHGRSRTQRDVVVAIAKQTLKFKNVTEISNIIDIFKAYVKTNLDLDLLKDYIPYAVDMNMDAVKVGRIPGIDDVVNGIWFFFNDEEGTKELVDELFNGKTAESSDVSENNNLASDNEIANND